MRKNGHQKKNGHTPKNGKPYRSAEERDDIIRLSGKDEVFIARNKETGALLGPVVTTSAHLARQRAVDVYGIPIENICIRHRSKDPWP